MIEIQGKSLFDAVGGKAVLARVHKIFYDKVYADAWIGQYFAGTKQTVIESQQTDFMGQAMGGPKEYCGKFPIPAHKHMYISEELFELRERLLKEALTEGGVPAELHEPWLRIDRAFKPGIVKKSPAECEGRFKTDPVLNFDKPATYKKAA
jgi:hemoglobin